MLLKENVQTISKLIDRLFSFVSTDEEVQKDVAQFIKAMGGRINSQSALQAALVPYVFERKIGDDQKSIVELFKEKNSDLTQSEIEVLSGLDKSISSVFEVKKILKTGFELYNLVNEVDYTALTLVKMNNFKGVVQGQYLVGRIFPYADDYYLVEINEFFASYLKENALKIAITKQMQSPSALYEDNPDKLKEIEQNVREVGLKFVDYFNAEELITTSNFVDELISGFNDYVENDAKKPEDITGLINLPEKYAYFNVKELTTQSSDFVETAAKGFSAHEKIYDTGIIYDLDLGLLVVPFYGTFNHIFEVDDYKSIEGYKECILNYLQSDKIPHTIILKIYNKNKNNFLKIVNEVLESDFSIDELLHTYKKNYLEKKIFSSPTVLYVSKAFNDLMGFVGKEEKNNFANTKTGRNDPCPCGSGKKYKKCCLG